MRTSPCLPRRRCAHRPPGLHLLDFVAQGVRHLGALGSLGHLPLKLLDASLLLGEKRLVAPLRVHCLRLFRLRDPFLAARLRCDLFLVVDAMVVSVHVGLPFD